MNKSALAAFALLMLAATRATATAVDLDAALRDDAPERYVVETGDTLWYVSGRFLDEPWLWPELWRANEQIANPHLIYPGDTIHLRRVDGEPVLVLERAQRHASADRAQDLDPRVRASPRESAIPTIDLEAIGPFLDGNRVLARAALERAPYVLQGENGRILLSARDRLYARGDFTSGAYAAQRRALSIVRVAGPLIDPGTDQQLGIEVQEVGVGRIVELHGEIATVAVSGSREEIRIGDRLVPTEARPLATTFFPRAPKAEVDGRIISVLDGVTQVGPYSVVALNLGERRGIRVGDVLGIHRQGPLVRDRIRNDTIRMPSKQAGQLMVFRTFERVSYGIVLEAQRPLEVLDEVHEPEP